MRKSEKSGLMKRTLIERLLEGAKIVGHENSAAKHPERVRRFCKAVLERFRNFSRNAFVGFNKSAPAVPQTA